jgi:hypothetical protein
VSQQRKNEVGHQIAVGGAQGGIWSIAPADARGRRFGLRRRDWRNIRRLDRRTGSLPGKVAVFDSQKLVHVRQPRRLRLEKPKRQLFGAGVIEDKDCGCRIALML